MIPGVISLLLLCMGFMNAEPNMFVAAGLFAIASEMSWFIFYIRKVFGLVSKKPKPHEPSHDKEW